MEYGNPGQTNGGMAGESPDDLVCSTLENGVKIPKLAMWNDLSKSVSRDIDKALQSGYRHIVISAKQDRDEEMKNCLARWSARDRDGRNQLFLTLIYELGPSVGLSNARQQILHRIHTLDCQYLDMIILHKPDNFKLGDNLRQQKVLTTTWKNLEKLAAENMTRSLSVSNFSLEELESLMTAITTKPQVIWFTHEPKKKGWKDLDGARRYCQYMGLHAGVLHRVDRPEAEWVRRHGSVIGTMANKHRHSALQIFIRFLIQRNILMSLAVDSRNIESSFKVYDFHLPNADAEELNQITL